MGFSSGIGVGGSKGWRPKRAPDNATSLFTGVVDPTYISLGFTANDNGSSLLDVPPPGSNLAQNMIIAPDLPGSVFNLSYNAKYGTSHNGYLSFGTTPTQGQSYAISLTPQNAVGKAASSSSAILVTPFPKPTVTGGTLFSDATYHYRLFTSSVYAGQAGALKVTLPNKSTTTGVNLEFLLVGSGGGGTTGQSWGVGAGGAAGGVRAFSLNMDWSAYQSYAGQFNIGIGSAGAGSQIDGNGNWSSGFSASMSSVGYYSGATYVQRIAHGGIGGRGYWLQSTDYPIYGGSGSGAGAAQWTYTQPGIAARNSAAAIAEYADSVNVIGNNGGSAFYQNFYGYQYFYSAGGGGGAGAVGSNGTQGYGGAGGVGINTYSSWLSTCGINNYSGYIAGGGGGTSGAYDAEVGASYYQNSGAGGAGGGGSASTGNAISANNAGQYSGGGGGALGANYAPGSATTKAGNGGSGFLIVRYLKSEVA